ncbi:hypothetical protein [Zoogloea sp.]|uniref:hypothetical protein n=1 Tax=Zoogloea sp. TaxID=49181 RepID=UPI001415F67E|nr:MAG: hypothetical protein F9K15_22780 [Zoogloea sp.]
MKTIKALGKPGWVTMDFTADRIYRVPADVSPVSIFDQISMRQSQLEASLIALTADSDLLDVLTRPTLESYLWGCEVASREIGELTRIMFDMMQSDAEALDLLHQIRTQAKQGTAVLPRSTLARLDSLMGRGCRAKEGSVPARASGRGEVQA